MITTRDLLIELSALGIERSERALVDWRQKGLLPPLKRIGLGRGKGTVQVWGDDILDQVIACHLLLEQYSRTESAFLGLWQSGFEVDHRVARQAWIRQIQKRQARVAHKAKKAADGYWSVGESWVKKFPEYTRSSELVGDFIKELPSWLYSTRGDSESFQMALAEVLAAFAEGSVGPVIPSRETLARMQQALDAVELENLFQSDIVVKRITAMTNSDFAAIHGTLRCVREVISHWIRITGDLDYVLSIQIGVRLMHGLIGPTLVHGLLSIWETAPKLPIEATVNALHSLAISVKYEDIQEYGGEIRFSKRIHNEWRVTRDQIEQLWMT